jgi:hypothetical protein
LYTRHPCTSGKYDCPVSQELHMMMRINGTLIL